MTVFCDNRDCCLIGEDGLCGCDKLSIVGGVCAGSYRSGRNVCDGDVDERLKAENAKLRERVAELEELLPDSGRWYRAETVEAYVAEIDKLRKLVDYMAPIALYGASEQERDRMRELGVEVD